jgi:hypothetical protein
MIQQPTNSNKTKFWLFDAQCWPQATWRVNRGGGQTAALVAALLVGVSGPMAFSGGIASAQPIWGEGGARRLQPMPKLTTEQQKKLFPGRKELLLKEHQERIALLQKSQSCVEAATNSDALKTCLIADRKANRELRRRMHERIRQLYERNGIQLPPARPGPGAPRRTWWQRASSGVLGRVGLVSPK